MRSISSANQQMRSVAQPVSNYFDIRTRLALSVVGFSAVVVQIVLMRELLIASSGNELSLGIMLALWLIWTAIGSNLLGRFFASSSARRIVSLLLVAESLVAFVAIFLARISRTYWNAAPGEVLGPIPVFLTALVTLAAFCLVSGWLFAAGSRFCSEYLECSIAQAGSSMYLFEVIGSAVGGLLVSIVLIRVLDSIQIVTVVAIANLISALHIGIQSRELRRALAISVLLCGILVFSQSEKLERLSISRAWPGFRVIATTTSPYGNLAVVEAEGNRSLIQNGIVQFTVPDPATAEEVVHFPLLQHPAPKSVLLIGGGLNGSIAEILKYGTIELVDYVELDPAVIRLGREHFPQAWAAFATDPRVHTYESDGRLFVKSTRQRYDVIILNLPEPQTAQLNRFYTEEFFREVASHLAPGGVFGFEIHASEEYLSPQLTEFLRCLDVTVRRAFPTVAVVPGEIVHFIASQNQGLTVDPQMLLARIKERGIHTMYLREYYLPFRMAPERVSYIRDQLQPNGAVRLNGDFVPIAYFFNVELWSTQFSSRYREVFLFAASIPYRNYAVATLIFAVLSAVAFAFWPVSSQRSRIGAGYAVAMMGMILMAAEILLLLGFQAVYGYVFNELAVIIAGFMAGMALGSWIALRREPASAGAVTSEVGRLLIVQIVAALLLLILPFLISGIGKIAVERPWAFCIHALFLSVATLFGTVGGYQFPIAMRIFSATSRNKDVSPGKLYGLDLLGASVGAIAISACLLPLFGFSATATIVAIANLGPVILVAIVLRGASRKIS